MTEICDERLVAVEQREKSNTKRLDKLEQDYGVLHEMAKSISVMAKEIEYMSKNLEDLNKRTSDIEERPAQRWEQVVSAVIVALIGVAVGYLFRGGM